MTAPSDPNPRCVCVQDYYKALEDADEKVQLANQIYDLVSSSRRNFAEASVARGRETSLLPFCAQVDRHLRKLDQELAKFKMELEADNAGITEILERRERALAAPSPPRRPHPSHYPPFACVCARPAGSLEMDSPSQPVNNHHAHSHPAAESELSSAPSTRSSWRAHSGFRGDREKVQRFDAPHDGTRPGEEIQVRSFALHADVGRLQGERGRCARGSTDAAKASACRQSCQPGSPARRLSPARRVCFRLP